MHSRVLIVCRLTALLLALVFSFIPFHVAHAGDAPPPPPPSASTLTIVKNTVGGDGTFSFSLTEAGSPLASPSLTTTSGTNTSDPTALGDQADTYDITESVPSGWLLTSVSCSSDGSATFGSITNGQEITADVGESITCTFTDTKKPVLTVIESVTNDNGGTKSASDFTINITGTNVSSASFAGSGSGTTVTLDAGSYSVDQTAMGGYSKSLSADCSGTIANAETKTCTITSNDDAPAPAPAPSSGGGGGGGGGANGPIRGLLDQGQVLGIAVERLDSGSSEATSTSSTASTTAAVATSTAATAPATGAPPHLFSKYLKPGSTDADVLALQNILAHDGYFTAVANGYFGPATEAAVVAYQKAHGLDPLGVVGPATRAALNAEQGGGGGALGDTARQQLIQQLTQLLQVLKAKLAELIAARQH